MIESMERISVFLCNPSPAIFVLEIILIITSILGISLLMFDKSKKFWFRYWGSLLFMIYGGTFLGVVLYYKLKLSGFWIPLLVQLLAFFIVLGLGKILSIIYTIPSLVRELLFGMKLMSKILISRAKKPKKRIYPKAR